MPDYKDIIVKRYAPGLSGAEIARQPGYSKSEVNDFLNAFRKCEVLSYPLPEGITNYGIAELVYGKPPAGSTRDESFVLPDYADIHLQLTTRSNMTPVCQWNRCRKACEADDLKFYSYRRFCERYSVWCEENEESAHFSHIIAQTMEIDFAGKTFRPVDPLTGEVATTVVFVAVLPYSQMLCAEGMLSAKEPRWIQVNNNAPAFFGGVPALVVCDNCKQAAAANTDRIQPTLNKDYADWAEHNHTALVPAKVKKPKYKSSVENAVGILEKGFFRDLEDRQYFSPDQFNSDMWNKLNELSHRPFKNREHNRCYCWKEEKSELMPLPSVPYEHTERKEAKVSSDFHVRFDNAYYSVGKAFAHQKVSIRTATSVVRIYSRDGRLIAEHERAVRKGRWCTNPEHLPKDYNDYREWNAEYFIRRAMTVGPCTVEVIKAILSSRKLEVQTYRTCLGVVNFAGKYGRSALEECCRQAIAAGRINYTFIKNSIQAVAEDTVSPAAISKINETRNQGAFVMGADAMDVENLLSRSQKLAQDTSSRNAYRRSSYQHAR